jgi:hypothetical protein
MKGMFITAGLIALSSSLATEPAKLSGDDTAKEQAVKQSESKSVIVSQNYYYAKPGKETEVLNWRLHFCDLLEKLGCKRGRVLRRLKDSKGDEVTADDPDVIWEVEYPDWDSLARDVQKQYGSPELKAAVEHMHTLLRKFERRKWQVQESPQ